MDLTASDPTGAWARWRARTPDLRKRLVDLLKKDTEALGHQRVVLGLSGGLDSTVAAYLFVEALGAANVFGVMLPYRTSDPLGLSAAQGIVNTLGITSRRVNISPMVDAYFANFPDASRELRATRLAWERLAILHDFGAHYGGQVVQIVNRSDLALDFGPDVRIGGTAYRPFAGLYKSQLRLLGQELSVPGPALERRPTLDSYPGQADESELGASYEVIDPALTWFLDQQGTAGEAIAQGLPADAVERVRARLAKRPEGAGATGLE